MKYQSIVLAAGPPKTDDESFLKCRFPEMNTMSLLELSVEILKSSQKIIIAVNPDDYDFFHKKELKNNVKLLSITHSTQGALPTSGMCLDLIDDDIPILISAVDGLCFDLIEKFLIEMEITEADGGVIVFPSQNPDYSYVRVSQSSPIEFAEKVRIGELATSGIYFFRNKKLLVDSIQWAILNRVSYENNYYLSSTMNKLIFENKRVVLFQTTEEYYFRFSTREEAMKSLDRIKVNNLG